MRGVQARNNVDAKLYSEYANNKTISQRKQRDEPGCGGSYHDKKGIESDYTTQTIWYATSIIVSQYLCVTRIIHWLSTSLYLNPVRTKVLKKTGKVIHEKWIYFIIDNAVMIDCVNTTEIFLLNAVRIANSLEPSPSWEANSASVGHEISPYLM
jgi:hypothetical protein